MEEINTVLLFLCWAALIAVELRFPPSRRGRWLLAGGYLAAAAFLYLVTIRLPMSFNTAFWLNIGAAILMVGMAFLLFFKRRPPERPTPLTRG